MKFPPWGVWISSGTTQCHFVACNLVVNRLHLVVRRLCWWSQGSVSVGSLTPNWDHRVLLLVKSEGTL